MLLPLGIILIVVGIVLSSKVKKHKYFFGFIICSGIVSIVVFYVGNIGFYDATCEVPCQTHTLESSFDYQEGDNIYYLTVVDDNFNFETSYFRINEEAISEENITFENGNANFPVVIKRLKGNSKLVQFLCFTDYNWILDGYIDLVALILFNHFQISNFLSLAYLLHLLQINYY